MGGIILHPTQKVVSQSLTKGFYSNNDLACFGPWSECRVLPAKGSCITFHESHETAHNLSAFRREGITDKASHSSVVFIVPISSLSIKYQINQVSIVQR